MGKLTDKFYARVMADPELSHFFDQSKMDKLRLMQREFFSAALDGPVQYTGIPLPHAHAGREIGSRHFARFVEHLLDTLEDITLSDRDVRDIIERVKTYHDEIVGTVGDTG